MGHLFTMEMGSSLRRGPAGGTWREAPLPGNLRDR